MKIHNLQKAAYIKALFYGDSGSGKTTLIGSATPPLVLDIESMSDFNAPYTWILQGQPTNVSAQDSLEQALANYLKKYNFEKFNSIAIDSITQVQRISRNTVLKDSNRLPGDMAKATTQQNWGQILSVLMNMADLYYKLPMHVFGTALARHDDVESMGMRLFHPFLWGQSALEVPSYAELVGRLVITDTLPSKIIKALETKTKKLPHSTLCTRSGKEYIAKWQGLDKPAPQYIFDPTIEKLLEIANT
jgi:hypothetical protein